MELTFDKDNFWPEAGEQLTCPICNFNYVHFNEPKFIDGKDDYKAWQGRGQAIRIDFWCESGHKWTLRIGFHKGQSYLKIEESNICEVCHK